jgi:tetratricopeptide (TPR) repeat protein
VKIWDVENEQEPLTLLGHTDFVMSVAFSRDGTRLASASGDHTVRIWDVISGQEVLTLQCPTGRVSGVAFSRDGTRLAAAGMGSTPVIWDARPLTPDAPLEREALGLLDFLFRKPLCKADVLDYLQKPQIRSQTRQLALSFVEKYHEEHDAEAYHIAGRSLARQRYLNPFQYEFAHKQAQTACRLAPKQSAYLTTLGMAQYRLGQYREAAETLARADGTLKGVPPDLALLAMAQHRLGQADQARAAMARLQKAIRQARWNKDEEAHDLLSEAESVLAAQASLDK